MSSPVHSVLVLAFVLAAASVAGVAMAASPAASSAAPVGQRCIHRLARSAGMRGFTTSSFWGRTQITPYGTARMFWNIDERVVARHRQLAMRWLRGVVPSQRWGLAQTVPPRMAIAFKGGFAGSPGGGQTVSQGALLTARNGHRISVAVLTNGSPGQPYGRETLRRIGLPLLQGYAPDPGR